MSVGGVVAPLFQLLLFLTWGGVPHENEIALAAAPPDLKESG